MEHTGLKMSKREFDDYKIKERQLAVSPFIYSAPSISSISIRFIVLLSLQVLMLALTSSYKSLIIVLCSLAGSLAAAALSYFIRRYERYQIMSIAIQGLIIGLLIPEGYPPVPVFFISFLTLFFSRMLVFKGVSTWLNMSAFAGIVAWIIGRSYFPPFLVNSEIAALGNSSVYLLQNGIFPIHHFDNAVTSFLNSTVFSVFRVTVPEGFVSLLWDSRSAIPAFRFTLLTIVSSIIVFSDNTFSGIIPSVFLLTYTLLVRLFAPMFFGGLINQGDVILALSSSGILFCTVFMIQWFGTVPVTVSGKVISALCMGVCAFLIIGCGTSPIGMMYTILINNVITLFIRSAEEQKNRSDISKVVSKASGAGI